jgi:Acetyl-CoA acetyltransferase
MVSLQKICREYQITRNDQDNFAFNSQKKAIKAMRENKLKKK